MRYWAFEVVFFSIENNPPLIAAGLVLLSVDTKEPKSHVIRNASLPHRAFALQNG